MRRAIVIDGFIDEPACLGVPPFLSPQVRAVFGSIVDAGAEATYLTIDQIRKGIEVPRADLVVVMAGAAVPGKYLRSLPASGREVQSLAYLPGIKVLGGPAALDNRISGKYDFAASRDPAATAYDLLTGRQPKPRWRTLAEWNRWLLLGSQMVVDHPDFPEPLIAEVETYRGCPRYKGGGCSFCVEPLKGRPVFRDKDDIVEEVRRLRELGVRNFRLGGQTDIISYMARADGEIPRPNPEAIDDLFSAISSLEPEVLHVDNANPAVIAAYPQESRLVLRSLVKYCTSGNVLALGMESADPKVIEANNLNSTPEQVLEAIRMINEAGGERGENGMPRLLPGLNFVIGLDGERKMTLELNLDFLNHVLDEGLLLRRINVRQVSPIRRPFEEGVSHSDFIRFKDRVRKEVDAPMLRKLVPQGTILRRVFTEIHEGRITFGRQIGTYPLLIGFPYSLPLNQFVDASVVSWGQRSVTAVQYPLPINSCPLSALESLPAIGRKRAIRLFRQRPLRSREDVERAIEDKRVVDAIAPFLSYD